MSGPLAVCCDHADRLTADGDQNCPLVAVLRMRISWIWTCSTNSFYWIFYLFLRRFWLKTGLFPTCLISKGLCRQRRADSPGCRAEPGPQKIFQIVACQAQLLWLVSRSLRSASPILSKFDAAPLPVLRLYRSGHAQCTRAASRARSSTG